MEHAPNLEESKTDLAQAVGAAVGKGAIAFAISSFGGIPLIGETIAELVGIAIPNRRLNRVIEMVTLLGEKIQDIDQDVRKKMKSEEWSDLLEDGMVQATKALSRERKEQIAAFLKYSLYHGELGHIQEKTLLSLLNELNDAQIIMLKSYDWTMGQEQDAFFERHQDVLVGPIVASGASVDALDRAALHKAYGADLQRLGLVKPNYRRPNKGESPQIDFETGMPEVSYISISGLGRLLLRYIDLGEPDEAAD